MVSHIHFACAIKISYFHFHSVLKRYPRAVFVQDLPASVNFDSIKLLAAIWHHLLTLSVFI
jgi:hypothetical protein